MSHTAKSIVLALSDKTTPEVTLELETPLAARRSPERCSSSKASAKSFTKEPFMLTMEIDKSKIYGWPRPHGCQEAGRCEEALVLKATPLKLKSRSPQETRVELSMRVFYWRGYMEPAWVEALLCSRSGPVVGLNQDCKRLAR